MLIDTLSDDHVQVSDDGETWKDVIWTGQPEPQRLTAYHPDCMAPIYWRMLTPTPWVDPYPESWAYPQSGTVLT